MSQKKKHGALKLLLSESIAFSCGVDFYLNIRTSQDRKVVSFQPKASDFIKQRGWLLQAPWNTDHLNGEPPSQVQNQGAKSKPTSMRRSRMRFSAFHFGERRGFWGKLTPLKVRKDRISIARTFLEQVLTRARFGRNRAFLARPLLS